jgi:transcriptional antiterminator NusG
MRLETKIDVIDFKIGDKVQIVSGPLDGFEGTIIDLDIPNQKAKLKVAMFSTETEVEVDFVQLKSLN